MIHWRDATRADRPGLQQFECTPPVQPRIFGQAAPPRPLSWELQVQGYIRDLRPPARRHGELILIGEDESGIAAVLSATEDTGPDVIFISSMAAALRLRGRRASPSIGEQMLTALIDRVASRADAAGYSDVILWGNVDVRNTACQKLCDRVRAYSAVAVDYHSRYLIRVDIAR